VRARAQRLADLKVTDRSASSSDGWIRPMCHITNDGHICQHWQEVGNCSRRSGGAKPTANGSWSLRGFYVYNLDVGLVGAITRIVGNHSVLELGAGTGCYTSALLDAGVRVDAAYDGVANVHEVTGGLVQHADLTTNLMARAMRPSDWVLCLEVAEHIPRHLEGTFLHNIGSLAERGLILSWSNSVKQGNGHVNPRPQEYVEYRLAASGFVLDRNETSRARAAVSTFRWFEATLQVYRKDAHAAFEHHRKLINSMWQKARPAHPIPPTLCTEAYSFPVKFLGVMNDGRRCGEVGGAPDDFDSPLCQGTTYDGLLIGVSMVEAKARCAADESCLGFYALQHGRTGQACGSANETCVRPVFAWTGGLFRSTTAPNGIESAVAFEKQANMSVCASRRM
jgi:hypothetical protein